MKRFSCDYCGATFDEPVTIRECIGEYWGVPAYETYTACPCCHSGGYEEVKDDEMD